MTTDINNLPVFADYPALTKREHTCLMCVWRDLLSGRAHAIDYVLNASNIYTIALRRADPDEFACWDTTRECFRDRDYIEGRRDTFLQWHRRSPMASAGEPAAVHQARLQLLEMALAEAESVLSAKSERFPDEGTAMLHRYQYALNIMPCRPYTA